MEQVAIETVGLAPSPPVKTNTNLGTASLGGTGAGASPQRGPRRLSTRFLGPGRRARLGTDNGCQCRFQTVMERCGLKYVRLSTSAGKIEGTEHGEVEHELLRQDSELERRRASGSAY